MRDRVRLVAAPAVGEAARTVLDDAQAEAVAVRQGGGPVVVLGAPGTGKTTTLIEAVLARVERDGLDADGVLVLAPTRTAAAALREQITGRLARTVREPLARTPHSYAFGLLRRSLVLDGDVPPRLISGPEQDRVLADLLAGHADGVGYAPTWPSAIDEQVRGLRAFRDELRDLLMRAVERGIAPSDLARFGHRYRRGDWVAASDVYAEYLDVTSLATPGAFDPAGIVDAASALLGEDGALLAAERARWQLVVVEDAQELTTAGARLVRLLGGEGRDLLLFGDPDVATQGFRGARPRLLTEAAQRLRAADGSPARQIVLRTVHRHGPALRAVATRVTARISSSGLIAHRQPHTSSCSAGVHESGPAGAQTCTPAEHEQVSPEQGLVAVHLLGSPAQEGAFVAQLLRRQHLDGGVPWRRMAVLVRSVAATAPMRRALAAAGVPVTVPGTELPVRDEPAVVPLRLVLHCALDAARLTTEVALELLGGPIGGADVLALRRLRQELRATELADGGGRASDDLLVELLEHPGNTTLLDDAVAGPALRVTTALAAARAALAEPGASAETLLWAVWQATQLGPAWRRIALSGGVSGARADRDLDAVVALFEAAGRFVDRLPHAGPAQFLEYLDGQDLPADTLAERAPAGEAVTLLTATGAAGREWDVVAVSVVQEGVWPDLRLRSSLLGAQELADLVDRGIDPGASAAQDDGQRRAVLDEELRLFLVAVTRARRHLVVTAVRSEDLLPSPLLDLVEPPEASETAEEVRPLSDVPRSMTLPALVAELRSVVVDTEAGRTPSGAARRRRAAAHLARLAGAGVGGAHPQDWYGLAEVSSAEPLRGVQESVRVSPSRVEAFDRCPLRWLLEQAGGRRPVPTGVSLGTLVHELAEAVPDGDVLLLRELLERRFGRLGLHDGWVGDVERAKAERMLDKLAAYVRETSAAGRELIATEHEVSATVGRAEIRGTVDRLERDAEGRLVVVDLKTGTSQPRAAELDRHAQLGVYQLAVEATGEPSGGAELVQLGAKTKRVTVQQQPPLAQDDDPTWAHDLVRNVADGMAAAEFSATVNPRCRMCDLRRCCPAQLEGRQVGS